MNGETTVSFKFKHFTFIVKHDRLGKAIYRDEEYPGDNWTYADGSIKDTSLDRSFRERLRNAVDELGIAKAVVHDERREDLFRTICMYDMSQVEVAGFKIEEYIDWLNKLRTETKDQLRTEAEEHFPFTL